MYKSIVADLRLKETGGWLSEAGSNHPANYMRRNMSKLAMDNADMRRGVGLANAALPQSGPETAEHAPWHGKSPPSIVGAVIHVVALLPTASRRPSLEDISKACGVAEATIKAVYRDMYPHLVGWVLGGGWGGKENQCERERGRRGGDLNGDGARWQDSDLRSMGA